MTQECLDRIKFYVASNRAKDMMSAQNSRLNGYKTLALDHENRAMLADLILKDLASEGVQNANHS